MKILSVHIGHDSSATVLENGKVVFYQVEERLSREKHSIYAEFLVNRLIELNHLEFDLAIISCLDPRPGVEEGSYGRRIFEGFKSGYPFKIKEVIYDDLNHHREHLYASFYHSGFDEALCFILDGAGSRLPLAGVEGYCREIETVYHMTKEGDKVLFKHYHNEGLIKKPAIENGNVKISGEPSVGWLFEDGR